MVKPIVIAIIFLISGSVFADQEDESSGNYYLTLCKNNSLACREFIDATWANYLAGVATGANISLNVPDGFRKIEKLAGYCFPAGVVRSQIRDVFVNYLQDHPEQRHLDGYYLARTSWQKAWPCR